MNAAVGMPCPVCKVALVMSDRQGVEIDYCPQCRGVWLDRGELDKIIERSAAAEMPPQPAPAPQAAPPPQGGFAPQAMANSTKAMGMATLIKSAESRFWKSCSTKPRRVTQKKGRLSAALFLTFRLINQLKTG